MGRGVFATASDGEREDGLGFVKALSVQARVSLSFSFLYRDFSAGSKRRVRIFDSG